jgi:predicted Zn-dependent protease
MALVASNEPARAKQVLDGLLMQQGYGPAYYARAMANYGLRHKADALADIEAALRSAPDNPNLLQWRSRIQAMP